MKKIVLLCAVFCGVLSLIGAELPAEKWKKSPMQGKFTFENKGAYPISMKCTEASAGAVVKEVGVWGRFACEEIVEPGKTYELKVTYKLTSESNPYLAMWTRGAANMSMNYPKSAKPRTVSRKITVKGRRLSIYLNMMRAPGELEIISVELNPVE